LVDYTHDRLPEWEDPQGSSNPIPYERLFSAIGLSEAQATDLKERMDQQKYINSTFSSVWMADTQWTAKVGETLLIQSGPQGSHLFVIIYGPDGIPTYGPLDQLVMASFCTLKDDCFHEPTCIVEPGEHEFIQRRSWVKYRDTRVTSVAHTYKMVGDKVWLPHAPVSAELLDKLRAGAARSPRIERGIKYLFTGGIPPV
jgi:hypothetical protein